MDEDLMFTDSKAYWAGVKKEIDRVRAKFGYIPHEVCKRKRFHWKVLKNGDMHYTDGGFVRYSITSDRLGCEGWLEHIDQKSWNDFNEFVPAYIEACKRAGIKTVPIAFDCTNII